MAGVRKRLRATARRVRRTALVHRRLLAAVLTVVAVLAALHVLAPPDPPRVAVLVAARDLPSGTVLTRADLRTVAYPPGTAPATALGRTDAGEVVGRTVAAPLAAGEPVLRLRLVGPDLAAAYAPRVPLPVRLPDAAVADLLRVGDRIDLLVSDPQARDAGATVVASGVPVLAVPGRRSATDGVTGLADGVGGAAGAAGAAGVGGRLLVLGVLPAEVPRVADAAVRGFLSVVWSR